MEGESRFSVPNYSYRKKIMGIHVSVSEELEKEIQCGYVTGFRRARLVTYILEIGLGLGLMHIVAGIESVEECDSRFRYPFHFCVIVF